MHCLLYRKTNYVGNYRKYVHFLHENSNYIRFLLIVTILNSTPVEFLLIETILNSNPFEFLLIVTTLNSTPFELLLIVTTENSSQNFLLPTPGVAVKEVMVVFG